MSDPPALTLREIIEWILVHHGRDLDEGHVRDYVAFYSRQLTAGLPIAETLAELRQQNPNPKSNS